MTYFTPMFYYIHVLLRHNKPCCKLSADSNNSKQTQVLQRYDTQLSQLQRLHKSHLPLKTYRLPQHLTYTSPSNHYIPVFFHSLAVCNVPSSISISCKVAVWLGGNTLVSINEVILRRARLVLGSVTICGWANQVNSAWTCLNGQAKLRRSILRGEGSCGHLGHGMSACCAAGQTVH